LVPSVRAPASAAPAPKPLLFAQAAEHNVSEVVRAGLRLLEEREERKQLELDALRAEIAAGRASGPAKSADAVFDRPEAGYAAQADR